MSKRLILILALVFVAGLTVAAFAEVQNVKVSGDLTMKGVARNSLTLKDNEAASGVTGFAETVTGIISQARVRVDADLTDNVSTTVRLLNERVWGAENDTSTMDYLTAGDNVDDTDVDIDLAYVTLKEFLYSPLTLTVGRQELRFGNALIIGDSDTNNLAAGPLPDSMKDLSLRKAFDAVRANLNYDPLVLDLIYSKIDENSVATYTDTDLYGVNAGYALNKTTQLEGYYFQRVTDSGALVGSSVNDKAEYARVAGLRAVYAGIENLTLGVEGAYQFGNKITNATLYPDEESTAPVSRKRKAFAVQAGGMYVMPKVKYTPAITAVYTYLSGEKYKSISDTYTGWDPFYEDQDSGIKNLIAASSNAHVFYVDGAIKPMTDLTLDLAYTYIMLAQAYPSSDPTIRLTGITTYPTYKMKGDTRDYGHSVDLNLTYDYTEDVQLALMTGAFIPGNAFDSENKKAATQVIGSMKVTF